MAAIDSTIDSSVETGRRRWPEAVLAEKLDEVGDHDLLGVAVAEGRPAGVEGQGDRLARVGGGEVEGGVDAGDDLCLPSGPPFAALPDRLLKLQVKHNGPESMPELAPMATYMTLAPFIGADEAYERATEESDKW